MSTLVFDIETVGENFDELDETSQTMLTRWLKAESYDESGYKQALANIKDGMGFSPLTGQICAIGVLDAEKNRGAVYYFTPTVASGQAPKEVSGDFEENGISFKQFSEKEMLEHFWAGAAKYQNFVSFNGRGFDVPYLMIRSAVHRVKPTKNLLSNRYLSMQRGCHHIDLMDQLSFYGAAKRKGSLHLYCRVFGIESPKSGGVSGDDVAGLFKDKKFLEIAKYNVGDLRATKELYELWKAYLDI